MGRAAALAVHRDRQRPVAALPSVRLSGAIRDAATRAGVVEIMVSLSHCDEYATAIALVVVTVHQAIPAEPRTGGMASGT